MSFTFNLVDEPFVPCLLPNGMPAEYGLAATLARAHEIREVRDPSPLVTAALLRLLLTVLHRNFGPESKREWGQLWQAGRFDAEVLGAYWQRWRGRFDLFDADRPFYQTAGFRAKEPVPAGKLAHEVASGNNATLFDHHHEQAPAALTPPQAARLLIAQQGYAVGGGKSETGYTTSGPLLQGALVLPQGATLFEMLMLNLIAYNDEAPIRRHGDAPVWERDQPPQGGHPAGYLDYLTWQSRALALHPETVDGRVVVRRVSLAQGRKFEPAQPFFDPMVAYRADEKAGWRAVRLQEDRELWRDSGSLFQLPEAAAAGANQDPRPRAFVWLATHAGDGRIDRARRYDLAVFGLCTDKAKVNFWRHDRMPLPLKYLDAPDLIGDLRTALKAAEDIARALRQSVRCVAELIQAPAGGQRPDPKRVAAAVEALAPERRYWSRLEVPFRQFLVELAAVTDDRDRVLAAWACDTLVSLAWSCFEETAGRLDHSGRVLRAVVRARGRLAGQLAELTSAYRENPHEQTA